jgi:type I site-specific restriction endonuclease
LRFPVKFAHGPLGENKAKVPKEYQEVDNGALVEGFNNCEFPILVGTSAVSTGTDIRSVKTMVYLKGGKSEIEVRQGVGRCTRLDPTVSKTACVIYDFDVENISVLHKHALVRQKIFEDIYPEVEILE